MSKYRYSWTRAFGVEAQTVGEVIESLPERSPEAFVAASKKRDAPTHSLFEWDDSTAAAEYRLTQARVVFGSLEIRIVDAKGEPETIKAWIGSSTRGSYTAVLEASPQGLTAAEQRCIQEMRKFKRRWSGLQLARAVIDAMQSIEQQAARRGRKKKAA